MLFKAEYMLSHVTLCTYSDQLVWNRLSTEHIQENKDSLDATQAIETKNEAYPETSLNNNNNNAPKCLFPSLADTTDMRPELGTSTPRNRMKLKYTNQTKKKRKTKGNVCFLFVECVASYGKLTTNCGPVEKLYCTIGNSYIQIPPPKQSRLRAEEISHS